MTRSEKKILNRIKEILNKSKWFIVQDYYHVLCGSRIAVYKVHHIQLDDNKNLLLDVIVEGADEPMVVTLDSAKVLREDKLQLFHEYSTYQDMFSFISESYSKLNNLYTLSENLTKLSKALRAVSNQLFFEHDLNLEIDCPKHSESYSFPIVPSIKLTPNNDRAIPLNMLFVNTPYLHVDLNPSAFSSSGVKIDAFNYFKTASFVNTDTDSVDSRTFSENDLYLLSDAMDRAIKSRTIHSLFYDHISNPEVMEALAGDAINDDDIGPICRTPLKVESFKDSNVVNVTSSRDETEVIYTRADIELINLMSAIHQLEQDPIEQRDNVSIEALKTIKLKIIELLEHHGYKVTEHIRDETISLIHKDVTVRINQIEIT